jgi:DDE family transposase
MIPITSYPAYVEKYAPAFQEFFSKPQYEHFKEYLSGLVLVENPAVSNIAEQFVYNRGDQSSLNRFLTVAQWREKEVNSKRIELAKKELKFKGRGAVVIDDTKSQHYGELIWGAYNYKGWNTDGYHKAQLLINAHYVEGAVDIPIDYRIYHRTFLAQEKAYLEITAKHSYESRQEVIKRLVELLYYRKHVIDKRTKVDLACELIEEAERCNLEPGVYLFDTIYTTKQMANKVESYRRQWIGRIAINRLVLVENRWTNIIEFLNRLPSQAFRQVEIKKRNGEKKELWAFSRVMKLKQLGWRRVVAAYDNEQRQGEPELYVTSNKQWEAKKILQTWEERWVIEPFHRESKQHLGYEACQLRKERGVIRHYYLVLLAYTLLRLEGASSVLMQKVVGRLESIGQVAKRSAWELVRSLVLWIHKQLEQNFDPEVIYQLLLPKKERNNLGESIA